MAFNIHEEYWDRPLAGNNQVNRIPHGIALPLPRLVPSGKMPTHSPFFSMRAARFKAVRSALPRFIGESANARNNHAQKALACTKQGIAGN